MDASSLTGALAPGNGVVRARVIVLAAGTLESTRLLLNSGLANSSGVLGHYLCDQIYGAGVVALPVPEARNAPGT